MFGRKKRIVAYRVDFDKIPFSNYELMSRAGFSEILIKGNLISNGGMFTSKMLKKLKIKPKSKGYKDAFVKVAISPNEYDKSFDKSYGLIEKNLFSTGKPVLLEKGYTTNNSNALRYYSDNGKALTKKQLKKISF